MRDIKLLDATIRDGGLVNDFRFDDRFVRHLYETNCAAGVDYMEIGYRADKRLFSPDNFGPWKFASDEDIRRVIGEKGSTRLCVMTDVGRTNLDDIHPISESMVDVIRVASYIDTIPEAIRIIDYAAKMGYQTTCNIMAVSCCTDAQLVEALHLLAQSPVMTVYLVDSYGALSPAGARRMTELFYQHLAPYGKQVGIHCHNNLQCAFANTIEAIGSGATYLDAALYGMGRGAGNCHMETLVGYLLSEDKEQTLPYQIEPLLQLVEEHMLSMKQKGPQWGYNTSFMLTAITNQHPRAAINATLLDDHHYVAQLQKLI